MGRTEEASILSAVDKLEGDRVKIRTEGLDDLRRIFSRGKDPARINALPEDVFHKILEVLFRIVRTEKPAYLRATRPNSQTAAASRLTTASAALRLVIEAAGPRLKHKTANAVLDHVVDILPEGEEGLCSPIETDYLKVFRIILEYPPHTEHLRPKQWQTYVDFLLETISLNLASDISEDGSQQSRQASMISKTAQTMSIRVSQSSNDRSVQRPTNMYVDDLLAALHHLTNAGNAPILSRINEIVEVMLTWIETTTHSHELAFTVLNNILPLALTESLSLATLILDRASVAIPRLWDTKFPTLKDQMLITLFYSRHVFMNTLWQPQTIDTSVLDTLISTIWSDLEKPKDKDKDRNLLQVDDLSFMGVCNPNALALYGNISMTDTSRVNTIWATLYILAALIVALEKRRRHLEPVDDIENAPKRRKLDNSIPDILQRLSSQTTQTRVLALQLALFIVDQADTISTSILEHLSQFDTFVIEDDTQTTSWLLILMGRCTMLEGADSLILRDTWQRAWAAASRSLSSSACSRSACYLMERLITAGHLTPSLSGQQLSDAIFSEGNNGPGSFTDSAIILLTKVIDSGLLDSERHIKIFTGRSLNWLESQWVLPSIPDRLQNSQIAIFGQPYLLLGLLSSIEGRRLSLRAPAAPISTSLIHRAALIDRKDLTFAAFMLQDDHRHLFRTQMDKPTASLPILRKRAYQTKDQVTDFLSSKTRSFRQAWMALSSDRASNITSDIIEIVATACVLSSINSTFGSQLRAPSVKQVDAEDLWQDICDWCLQCGSDKFELILGKLGTVVLKLRSADSAVMSSVMIARQDLVKSMLDLVSQNLTSQHQITFLDLDLMDPIETRTSQGSQTRKPGFSSDLLRHYLPPPNDNQTTFAQVLFGLKIEKHGAHISQSLPAEIISQVIKEMISLSPFDLLLSRNSILELLEHNVVIARADACSLLQHLAKVYLQEDHFERCEVSLCFCLDVLASLVRLWTSDEDDGLGDCAFDFYNWYLNVTVSKHIVSQRVMLSMSALLEKILQYNASYGTDTLPSPRTTLLQMLKIGSNETKFTISTHLLRLFDGYVLGEHAAIFDDIVDNLPTDPDNREGIALRLYVLAYLGGRWHTILRQAVYHIFETAANVPAITMVAQKCVHVMCTKLEMKGPQVLLCQFAPQILYTWLERERINTIPFAAFGYARLTDLVSELQDELVAQAAMRASSELAQQIVQHLVSSWDALIERSFPRAVAYAMLADVCLHRSSQEIGKAENFIIQQLGDAHYAELLDKQLPEVIAIIMSRLTDDKGFEKAFSSDEARDPIILAFNKICHHSSSNVALPPGQQPSFRAKYVLSILNRACAHTDIPITKFWTPATFVSVCRLLLDDARPVFGPLHACAIIRKVRLLICLAGDIALSGYALTMLLHNLRPFLTQFHCSEDTIGIVWYLLEQGRSYLKLHLSYVAGLSVAIFASLSQFVNSSQDSTTQESHYISTMSKAQEFRKWLGDYLVSLETLDDHQSRSSSSFGVITRLAREIQSNGNSDQNTTEGSLLYHLLIDQAKTKPLLSDVFFRLTLRSLCHYFKVATDPLDDIIVKDRDVVDMSFVLWSILNDIEFQDSFRVWAAQALGRAYAIAGPEEIIHSSISASNVSTPVNVNLNVENSYSKIIEHLAEHLWGAERPFASAAEQTLQQIFSLFPVAQQSSIFGSITIKDLYTELRFQIHRCPKMFSAIAPGTDVTREESVFNGQVQNQLWASHLVISVCNSSGTDPILSSLKTVVQVIPDLAIRILPAVIHIVLVSTINGKQTFQDSISDTFMNVLSETDRFSRKHVSMVLDVILYLRRCTFPTETIMAQRNTWLTVDYQIAAEAAARHNLYHTALLMIEIHASQLKLKNSRSTKRSSSLGSIISQELVAKIYQKVDDPDFFYGTMPGTDMGSVVQKLSHEGAGYKALSFQSALFDSSIRSNGLSSSTLKIGLSTATVLASADLHGLANSLKQSAAAHGLSSFGGIDLQSSLGLQQWDVWQAASADDDNALISNAFRVLSSTSDRSTMVETANVGLLQIANNLANSANRLSLKAHDCALLAILAEIKEAITIPTYEDLRSRLQKRGNSQQWARKTTFGNIECILLAREALFGTIRKNSHLRELLNLSFSQSILLEIYAIRASLDLAQAHDVSQFSLNRATYLSELIPIAEQSGLKVQGAINYDLATTLWAHDETSASLAILQSLHARNDLKNQVIAISLPEILTDLGQKMTEARLERPDEITSQYLTPAIKALGSEITGSKAGKVYHNFAAFCDQQLRDHDNLDEYARIEKLRNRKKQEVDELKAMEKTKEGKEKAQIRSHLNKAETWFDLDEQEWKRLKQHHEDLIEDCLENYLRAMRACEDFPNDVLRFLALWLEQSGNADANKLVAKHLPEVPSYKFAPLINQLSSRILDKPDQFQRLLFDLMYRISNEHPFHSLYQVFAASKSKAQKSDVVGTSRHTAANKLTEAIMKKGSASSFWVSIHNISIAFVKMANEKFPDKEIKSGSKIQLRKLPTGLKMDQTVQDLHHKIPPPTMALPLRPDKKYSSIPTLARFDASITIAGGVSAPKIVTGIASDGSKHKMLLKGGNDDLRQDSIMEQVFEQVSNLLKDHRATRQRKLGIRTYKVIPLTTNAGIIEFVKDTMPLHDYVLPAHARYYPKDFKPNKCRKEILDAQSRSLNHRLQAYRNVTANFHPVMRFFFMEHFLDPNEWFEKRLNYTRSTAAISMLGHVLGVGDRHGHNILLDTNTGEVVHIDLGVAFEAGRVLPVPEVVPFRLTRDLVDGMGLSGVEGVFRRCCNFSLEALRQDQEAIMTILDVLRWDPLYSWSISPLRLQRMQKNQEEAASTDVSMSSVNETGDAKGPTTAVQSKTAMGIGEPGEADRALAIVAKKLGKGLSVEATVNELIRQATDERNLAVLYCGWAAYA